MSHQLQLGPFILQKPIGQGGMGEVWRGFHVTQKVDVAVKILKGARARSKASIEDFHNEARAVAGLNHPGIVMVFDHGDISQEVSTHSGGYFTAGSPYMAMEFASKGSMEKLTGVMPWPELRYVMLSLLDALAHAHARGVIHRDLKPANILLASDQDARPGLKLTDFGIAHSTEHHSSSGSVEQTQGTPYYMAPEQCMGKWRNYGPWTDLYALGCVAYQFICGFPPFRGNATFEIMAGHLTKEPPPLRPRMEVPEGVEAWIHRLLQKSPSDRFVRAADAAWALINIADTQGMGIAERPPMSSLEATLLEKSYTETSDDVGILSSIYQLEEMVGDNPVDEEPPEEDNEAQWFDNIAERKASKASGEGELPSAAMSNAAPPMPSNWHRSRPPIVDMRLIGVGLGLYGLRSIALVGRVAERDTIWKTLLEARSTSRPRLLHLDGGAGVGKSRLVEWMCQRAHELGAATVLHATHSPNGGPGEGLARMVGKHLSCIGLDHEETLKRVRTLLKDVDDHELRALAHFISPIPGKEPAVPAERHALVRRMIERLGEERPIIVWLDDVQWAPDALDFVQTLFEATDDTPRPILLLLTARPEALALDAPTGRVLNALFQKPGASHHQLNPLDAEEHEALVKELLGLDNELTNKVISRTSGNPLFAAQLVGDWVQRGVLEVSESGFRLKEGEEANLPDNIHEVWCSHLKHLLARYPSTAIITLELAAVLGHEVDTVEWQRACTVERIPLTLQFLSTLLSAKLAVRTDSGWRITHGLLRESLLRIARDTGRLYHHHRACATMLYHQPPAMGRANRIANHLLQAGEFEAALDPIYHSAFEHKSCDEYHDVFRLADLHDDCLKKIGAGPDDVRYARTNLLRAEVQRLQGHFAQANKTLAAMFATARRHNHLRFEALGLIEKGHLTRHKGDIAEADSLFAQAVTHFQQIKDARGMARAIDARGETATARGELHMAEACHKHALQLHEQLGDAAGSIQSSISLARLYERAGVLDSAMALYRRALAASELQNRRYDMAVVHNGMGEIHRSRGELDAAEREYRRGLIIQQTIGNEPNVLTGWINLSLVLIARGRYEEAQRDLTIILDRYKKLGWMRMLGMVHILMLPCLAHSGNWPRYKHHLQASALIGNVTPSRDEAEAVHNAAMMAHLAGRADMARPGFDLALSWWSKLGREDRIAQIKGLA